MTFHAEMMEGIESWDRCKICDEEGEEGGEGGVTSWYINKDGILVIFDIAGSTLYLSNII